MLDSVEITAGERGALLALLGSIERAEGLIERIVQERGSVDRSAIRPLRRAEPPAERRAPDLPGGLVPAE